MRIVTVTTRLQHSIFLSIRKKFLFSFAVSSKNQRQKRLNEMTTEIRVERWAKIPLNRYLQKKGKIIKT